MERGLLGVQRTAQERTDHDGNVIRRSCSGVVDSLFWDTQDRLIKFKTPSKTIEYKYDPESRLVRRDVNGSVDRYFLWSGATLFAELDGSKNIVVEYSYYPGLDRLHAIAVPNGSLKDVYFAHSDGLGNVIGMVNATNSGPSAQYEYGRWGQKVYASGSADQYNRVRFKGALWMDDQGPELYYMRNRWYEPRTGRFLSEDPIGLSGGINQYTFAAGNPVSMGDPTGTSVSTTVDEVNTSPWGLTGSFGGGFSLGILAGMSVGDMMDDMQSLVGTVEKEWRKGRTSCPGTGLRWPVDGVSRSEIGNDQDFGPRYASKKFHKGIDIPGANRVGAPVLAAAAGDITYAHYRGAGFTATLKRVGVEIQAYAG